MKKLIAILLTMLITFFVLSGCNQTKQEINKEIPCQMTIIDKTDGYVIYKHDKTGVCYFCVIGSDGRSACVMLNPDGTPYTLTMRNDCNGLGRNNESCAKG